VVDAFTIFVTSPKRWRWKEWRKAPGGQMLYLPVYSEEEMFRLRDLCFPHLDDMGVEERYWKWGGIPRSVLLETAPLYQAQLEREISTLRYEDALALLDDKEAAEAMTDVAVHIKIQVCQTRGRQACRDGSSCDSTSPPGSLVSGFRVVLAGKAWRCAGD
jgi:hypothetical protein